MSDSVGIHALIAAICLVFGAQGYLAILYVLFCAAGVFTIAAMCSQTTMAHLGAAFGASTLAGAAAQHCWAFRGAFAKRVK